MSDTCEQDETNILGRLLWSFIAMAKNQPRRFTLGFSDILHGCSIDSVSDLSDMEITILNGKARSGRHRALFGPRSWIFDASVKSATGTANHILKFHWHNDNSSEVFVHAKVEEFGVPHTPQLLETGDLWPAK
ncbi:hypothetical protein LPJ69_003768 [Coemansia sp. RSA 1752]|nr:hypothetical protein LPJ69_003768 [Coemansia sp. RSA 1752]